MFHCLIGFSLINVQLYTIIIASNMIGVLVVTGVHYGLSQHTSCGVTDEGRSSSYSQLQ
jgi:hypothetical protein